MQAALLTSTQATSHRVPEGYEPRGGHLVRVSHGRRLPVVKLAGPLDYVPPTRLFYLQPQFPIGV